MYAPSFSALTSSSFSPLTDFSAAATADALKWTDFEQNVACIRLCLHVQLILSMVNRSFSLPRKLIDLAVEHGHVVC